MQKNIEALQKMAILISIFVLNAPKEDAIGHAWKKDSWETLKALKCKLNKSINTESVRGISCEYAVSHRFPQTRHSSGVKIYLIECRFVSSRTLCGIYLHNLER